MTCTINPVKINQCPEVTDLSLNNTLLCKSCCLPSRKFVNVKVGETIVSGDLVKIDPATGEASVATAVADIKGVADCSATATADCPGQICVYVRDALLKCGSINYGALAPALVDAKLEELRIFLAFQI
jgi:hypothetical protein